MQINSGQLLINTIEVDGRNLERTTLRDKSPKEACNLPQLLFCANQLPNTCERLACATGRKTSCPLTKYSIDMVSQLVWHVWQLIQDTPKLISLPSLEKKKYFTESIALPERRMLNYTQLKVLLHLRQLEVMKSFFLGNETHPTCLFYMQWG